MVERMPITIIEARIIQIISHSEVFWRKINLYTFRENIEEAERMEESAEDITAAETAPSPTKDTKSGVRYWRTIGKIVLTCCSVKG